MNPAAVSAPARETRRRRGVRLAAFWDGPLGYPQAALVVLTALAIGAVFHHVVGYRARLAAPWTWLLAAGFTLAVGIAARRGREHAVVRWLTGVPFAICSLLGVGALAAVGACVPSAAIEARWGVASVYVSWPFRMALGAMLVNLVGVTARRCWPLTYTNVTFTLSHLGLTLAILGGMIGESDLERGNLMAWDGRPTATATRPDGSALHLPFAVTLRRFTLRHFPPTLAVARSDERAPGGFAVTPGPAFVRDGMRERIGEHEITVTRFLPRAALVGETWREAPPRTGAPAAFVVVRDPAGRTVGQGWVSSGGPDTTGAYVRIGPDRAVYMPRPRPREYRSLVTIAHRDGRSETREILVNRPATIAGYRLYQLSYDEERGAASEYSVFDVVADKGLPAVYAGMFLLLGGALLGLAGGVTTGERRPR
jgi:hypothetical protein